MSALLDPRLAECRRIFLHDFAIDASIGFHDHDGDIDFQYTSFDIDLLFCARFLSR